LNRPRIIYEDVDPTKVLQHALYHGVHLLSIYDIAGQAQYLPMILGEVMASAFQLRLIAGANRDMGALLQQVTRHDQA
jgi:hypothetical protein